MGDQQLPDDPHSRLVDAPLDYGHDMTGLGRWCWLGYGYAPERLAVLWTDDGDNLGVQAVGSSPEAVDLANRIATGLWAAKAAGSPATVVFDAYAARASQALACLGVESGALTDLPSRIA